MNILKRLLYLILLVPLIIIAVAEIFFLSWSVYAIWWVVTSNYPLEDGKYPIFSFLYELHDELIDDIIVIHTWQKAKQHDINRTKRKT